MKKIVLTLVAMLSMTGAFAENEGMEMTKAYTFNVSIRSLANALDLDNDQVEAVAAIQETFSVAMMNAVTSDGIDREAMTKSAVEYAVRNMGAVLTKNQLRTYCKVLNATLNNRGIRVY